ncbi:MAG: formimidoylglutamate deiminase [Rhodospirillaceae bacterium]|nr:formimidoylglutamate deiminase [Rhodospirillaceae bacterium]
MECDRGRPVGTSSISEVSGGSFFFRRVLLPTGWAQDARVTTTRDGVIRDVQCNTVAAPDDTKADTVIPGIANVHSHAFQRGMAGLAEKARRNGDNFWTWREVMFRFATKLTPDDVEAIAALAYVEMLERGFNRVGEFHYLHHSGDGSRYADPAEMAKRIAAAAHETRIGLTLLPVLYTRAGFDGGALHPGQMRFISDIEEFARLVDACRRLVSSNPECVVGVAPHSLRAVTPGELHAVLKLGAGGPIHIHAAEQQLEVDECIAHLGTAPVEWLIDNADVDDRWCFVHATHITETEAVLLARSGGVVGACPVTEANLGDGIFPLEAYQTRKGVLGVGTDSNIMIGLADELRALEYSQRLAQERRNIAADGAVLSTGRVLFNAAGEGGARAMGTRWGIAAGQPADFVALDTENESLCAFEGDDLLDTFIFSSRGRVIKDVWRAGQHIVKDGSHIHRAAIAARYRKTLKALVASL